MPPFLACGRAHTVPQGRWECDHAAPSREEYTSGRMVATAVRRGCSATGRPLDAANGRRGFRLITRKAGIGESWSPRELRHSFVSIMSDGRVPIEAIADLCGHSSPTHR
nr:tyrosine-type recombinase/integrase [Actinomadura darangshiensis]